MTTLIEISPSEARALRRKQKKQILRRISGQTDLILHCEAIVIEDQVNGALMVSTSPCPVELGSTFLVRRQGFPNLFKVSYEELATLRLIGAGRDFRYKAFWKFGDETSFPVPDTI